MSSKITETAQRVLEERYFLGGETKWTHLAHRVADHFANSQQEYEEFKQALDQMDFLPNSPTLMNAGTSIKAFSACYVLPVEDSIESIYKFYGDAAVISKSGGGVGCNYSSIRSAGATVASTDGVASGPLSFMKVQDVSTDIIKQGGRRRGANMGILMCDHPDIWDFVAAKDTEGVLSNFNLSVGITDEFMSAVQEPESQESFGSGDESPEAKLWDEVIQRAWESAEPGVLFMDSIEAGNTVPHLGKLEATNPCGEQPLRPYESCTLGSINLSNHVNPYSDLMTASVNWEKLKETTRTGVLFLNRILDKSTMPIPECQEAMELTRKIGLGIMGLHDMLIQLGLPYDSEEGRSWAGSVMEFIEQEADFASQILGREEGYYDGLMGTENNTVGSPYRRNANLTTIAPTGSLSMLADCSSGCEPYYAPVTYKTVLDGVTFVMPNKWLEKILPQHLKVDSSPLLQLGDIETYNMIRRDCTLNLPCVPEATKELFKGAEDIHWSDHIKMQGVLQQYIDSSISKTINCPNETTVEEVKEMYELAYELGCKGVTIYRDGSRETQVLDTKQRGSTETRCVPSEARVDEGNIDVGESEGSIEWPPTLYKLDLPDDAPARRHRVSVDGQKVYLIVTQGDEGEPLELFVKFPYSSIDTSWTALCRQLSLSLRYGIPLSDIVKQLDKSVSGVGDMSAKISRVLKKYLPPACDTCGCELDGFFCPHCDEGTYKTVPFADREEPIRKLGGMLCPECNCILTPESGCWKCSECGWSKCS